jgi:2-polyprenyl-3-methyl-5-hydroxy-6-metoxy-1,4-benzoquinol methylase
MKKCWCGNDNLSEYNEYYCKCDACGTLVLKKDLNYDVDHVTDEDRDFYGKEYWEKKMVLAAGKENIDEVVDMYIQHRAIYWLSVLFRYLLPGKGNIAEVGCGLGQFSYLLDRIGYSQTAFELSPQICRYIEQTLKINIKSGTFSDTDTTYDMVTAMDVLEHIENPTDFIDQACRSTTKNGLLFLQTPNYNNRLSYDEMTLHAPGFKDQLREKEHVFLYSHDSITRLLKEHGFSHVVFEHALFGDDYDMFLIAGKKPVKEHDEKEIDRCLDSLENGRLIKALIKVWTDKETYLREDERLEKLREDIEKQGKDRLKQIDELTKQVQKLTDRMLSSEQRSQMFEEQCVARLDQINQLTAMVHERDAQIAGMMKKVTQGGNSQ